eukprot:m.161630 g.161630  ORF g.161630 m.161630 type:complete len:96 (-) comp24858_c0_seq10:114-401(-)
MIWTCSNALGTTWKTCCINMWLDCSSTCPVDRTPLKRTELHPCLGLRNLVRKETVKCPFCVEKQEREEQDQVEELEEMPLEVLLDHVIVTHDIYL